MPDILSLLSIAFLPLLITIILVWGIWKKVPIYDTFIKGAKAVSYTHLTLPTIA